MMMMMMMIIIIVPYCTFCNQLAYIVSMLTFGAKSMYKWLLSLLVRSAYH